jgi:phage tail tape-measure protein
MRTFDNTSMEYSPEMEAFPAEYFEWGGEAEWGSEAEGEGESEVFHEAELMELAQELLEVTNEAELDRFLGSLIKKAGSAIGSVIRSPIGQAVGGYLKGAAKRALPLAGAALGGYVGGPLGAKIGSGLASAAGSALGLEAETLSAEDREFEGAKHFVRMAGDAVKSAAAAPPNANPQAVAQAAVTASAQKHAAGLLRGAPGPRGGAGRAGRWIRRGRNIIIVNC